MRPHRQARGQVLRPLVVIAIAATAAFAALTAAVINNPSPAFDAWASDVADDVRAPWLGHAVRALTVLGLFAIVGPAVLLGAAFLVRLRRPTRAGALAVGAALAWASVWIVKPLVDRARPPEPLVHTAGQSYPSAHAANSVGWLVLAVALSVAIPTRAGRIVAIGAGASLAVLVGLSRIYLRAHHATDVLGGEALAVAMYAIAAAGAICWEARTRWTSEPPGD